MWRDFILSLTSLCRFSEPATAAEIAEVEQALRVKLHEDLRTLLEESNGVTATPIFPEFDDSPIDVSLVWSTSEILKKNTQFRTFDVKSPGEYPPFAPLLFFASEPNGDPLAFRVAGGSVVGPAVIKMSHEDYSRREPETASLREYLTTFLQFVGEQKPDAV